MSGQASNSSGELRCLYCDLDGTLLGKFASLFHDGDGQVTMAGARAIELCLQAGVEICIYSGRREAQVMEDARLFGQTSYIFEVGCGLRIDGDLHWLTEDMQPTQDEQIYEQIARQGVPELLLDEYGGRLEYHDPWHLNREVSHLYRGRVDTAEVDALLDDRGFQHLRLVDNGAIHRKSDTLSVDQLHCYHLIPRCASKTAAVAEHMRLRGYSADQCIAAGDSAEDLDVASVVGQFYLVRNAVDRSPQLAQVVNGLPNVTVTGGTYGAGVLEAVQTALSAVTPAPAR